MRIDHLSSDIVLFRGDSLAALATAFVDGQRVLLIDTPASEYDAFEVRDYLESDRDLRIERVLLTRERPYHAAALHVFKGAHIGSLEEAAEKGARLDWGRHRLDFIDTAGGAGQAPAWAIDAPDAGLVFVAERLAGNVALLGEAAPAQAEAALAMVRQRGGRKVIPAFGSLQDGDALDHARHYLAALGEHVRQVRAGQAPDSTEAVAAAIAAIRIEDCLPPQVHSGSLERYWHRANLQHIVARQLFPVSAAEVRDRAVQATGCQAAGEACVSWFRSTLAMLTCMLGRMARSGV